jgi:hypothetical protein
MKTLAPLLALLLAAQDKADYDPIYDVFYKHEKALRKIPGVRNLTVGGLSGRLRIIVQLEDDSARAAVLAYTGETLEGFPVHFLGGGAPPREAPCARCPVHCAGPGKTVATPAAPPPVATTAKVDLTRLDDPAYQNERCDIIRKWSGLPKLPDSRPPCQEMVSWSNDPAKIKWVIQQGLMHWRSKEMPGLRGSDSNALDCPDHGPHGASELICYTWIKHRQFCPLGMKVVMDDIHKATPTEAPRK